MSAAQPPASIVLATIARYRYGLLATGLHRRGLLRRVYTGLSRKRFRSPEIPRALLHSHPWLQMPALAVERLGLLPPAVNQYLLRRAQIDLDRHIARTLPDCELFSALSGCAVEAGAAARARGIRVVCERTADHIRINDQRLRAEFDAWGIAYQPTDPVMIEREEQEYAQADRIVVSSEVSRRSFIKAGVDADKLRIVHGDVSTVFQPDATRTDKADTERGPRLLFVGTQSLVKGFGHLLRGFARADIGDARLTVIGPALAETPALLRQCPTERVEFLGRLGAAEVARAMREADLLVAPSFTDGQPGVVYESLACGTPVIVSDTAGASEQIQHGVNGLIVRGGDSDDLAATLRRVADEPDLLKRLRAGTLASGAVWNQDGSYEQRWLAALT